MEVGTGLVLGMEFQEWDGDGTGDEESGGWDGKFRIRMIGVGLRRKMKMEKVLRMALGLG